MIKLRRYLEAIYIHIDISNMFIICASNCNFKLPSLMSDIVNVGIQSSGIESATQRQLAKME